ncbi:hypothetical protein ABPG73_009968 [Tetrahymena malaccensis]
MRKILITLIIAYVFLLQVVQCKKQLRSQNTEENNKRKPLLMQSGIKMDDYNMHNFTYYPQSSSDCFKICQNIGGLSVFNDQNYMFMCCQLIGINKNPKNQPQNQSRFFDTQCFMAPINCIGAVYT